MQKTATANTKSRVRIEFAAAAAEDDGAREGSSLHERLKSFIGSARGLPPDASQRIEFLYGTRGS